MRSGVAALAALCLPDCRCEWQLPVSLTVLEVGPSFLPLEGCHSQFISVRCHHSLHVHIELRVHIGVNQSIGIGRDGCTKTPLTYVQPHACCRFLAQLNHKVAQYEHQRHIYRSNQAMKYELPWWGWYECYTAKECQEQQQEEVGQVVGNLLVRAYDHDGPSCTQSQHQLHPKQDIIL